MSTILQIQNIDLIELKRLLREVVAEELLSVKILLNKDNNSPPPDSNAQLLSMKDAANFLHITTVTLGKYIKRGDIKFLIVGKRRRFKKIDLEKYHLHKHRELRI